MLNRIKQLFDRPNRALDAMPPRDKLHLAAACLLMEAARMDDDVRPEEKQRIFDLVRSRFGLTAEEAEDLVAAAETVTEGPANWYAFTSRLKDGFSYEERLQLIEMLWEVVCADGDVHYLEDNLLRRVGGLLYVSDRDRGAIGQRVKNRMGLGSSPT